MKIFKIIFWIAWVFPCSLIQAILGLIIGITRYLYFVFCEISWDLSDEVLMIMLKNTAKLHGYDASKNKADE